MAELEEKLNAILSDPQAMEQILSAARALSGQEAGGPREPEDTEKRSRTVFLPAAEPVLAELEAAQARCQEARLQGFDEAERAEFSHLSRRVRENLRRALE